MKRSKQMKWRMTLTFMKSGEKNRSKLMTEFYSIQSNFIHKLHDWFISRACYRWQPVELLTDEVDIHFNQKKIVDFFLLTFINHLLTFSYQINASLSTYVRYWGCIMTFGRWNRCTTIWLKRVYQRGGGGGKKTKKRKQFNQYMPNSVYMLLIAKPRTCSSFIFLYVCYIFLGFLRIRRSVSDSTAN